MAVTSAECLRRSRRRARSLGRCVVCTKADVEAGRSTCIPCSAAAAKRVERRRERLREQHRIERSAKSYEAAGDTAMARFSYAEAVPQFERALAGLAANPVPKAPEDRARLYEKIGSALFYGARPDSATTWFQRAIELCVATPSLSSHVSEAMQLLARQRWLESRTLDALDSGTQSRCAAVESHDAHGIRRSEISIASWLVLLGRYETARTLLEEQNDDEVTPLAAIHADQLVQRAILLATQGRAAASFAEFEHAIDVAKELPDGYLTTVIWDDYANWATALGRLDIARSCRERALFVARERRVAWRIPYLTLRLANMLVATADYDHARDLLFDALTYDTETPIVRVLVSTVGVEIAVARADRELLKRVMREDALELVFRSGEPAQIAPLAAAYAKVWIAQGQPRRAKSLINRAIGAINQADHAGDVLALAAQYGSYTDAQRARALLSKRARLPHGRVTRAELGLWEAYDARRRHAHVEATERALSAAKLFAQIGRHHRQAEALAIAGMQHAGQQERKPLASSLSPLLTAREQQVAELVLRGLTNRAIGQTLAISEHTVETHVTSILNRLGLRSRWQLIDLAHV